MPNPLLIEKLAAFVEAQAAIAAAVVEGRSGHRIGKKALSVYKRRVHANRRRLTR